MHRHAAAILDALPQNALLLLAKTCPGTQSRTCVNARVNGRTCRRFTSNRRVRLVRTPEGPLSARVVSGTLPNYFDPGCSHRTRRLLGGEILMANLVPSGVFLDLHGVLSLREGRGQLPRQLHPAALGSSVSRLLSNLRPCRAPVAGPSTAQLAAMKRWPKGPFDLKISSWHLGIRGELRVQQHLSSGPVRAHARDSARLGLIRWRLWPIHLSAGAAHLL